MEIWGWKKRKEIEALQERYLRWMFEVEARTPGYMMREKLQRDKLMDRAKEHGNLRRGWKAERGAR